MYCDKCGSDNTQRVEVAYEGGTQNIQTTSNTVGLGVMGGRLGVGGAKTSTSGVSRSALAERVAPPAKKKYAALVVAAWLFLTLSSVASGAVLTLVALSIFMLCVYAIYSAVKYNRHVWPGQYKHWQETWICHKCGNIYHHA